MSAVLIQLVWVGGFAKKLALTCVLLAQKIDALKYGTVEITCGIAGLLPNNWKNMHGKIISVYLIHF